MGSTTFVASFWSNTPSHDGWKCVSQAGKFYKHEQKVTAVQNVQWPHTTLFNMTVFNMPSEAQFVPYIKQQTERKKQKNQPWYRQFDKSRKQP